MGSESSKYNKNGGVAVQLENSSCLTGELVQGFIFISLRAPIAPSTLYLMFLGKEETHWIEHRQESYTIDGKTHRRQVEIPHSGKKKICDFKYPIWVFPDPLMPGDFSLPFTFRLPQNVPGSFHYEAGSTKAKIYYRFHAKLISKNDEKFKGKAVITLKQPVFSQQNQVHTSKEANLKTWCCVNKGVCKLHVDQEFNMFTPTQRADFLVQVDNSQSKLTVNNILGKLMTSIRLKSDSGYTHFVRNTLLNTSANKIVPYGDALMSKLGVPLSLDFSCIKELLEHRFTTKGDLVECVYDIEVQAIMDGSCMCCGDSPTIDTPIFIHCDKSIVYPPPYAPENWNPQQLNHQYVEYMERPLENYNR